ncbi:cytochrome P450 sterol C22-desaturase [Epithele typhae]|uniref:cytochrome P450 sterol C22-desaturase n=1 Tax=Epithele typhae TaxID=378194 RepID=UPI0020086FB2|nr:cytochrome P450 sterol C22-desaturase [Epithele typhae]KAH9927478.1 cytochrome P450 sterol C22-desaturase [Epithele typhae]
MSVLGERSVSASIPSFTAYASEYVSVPTLFSVSPETATWLWTTAAIVLSLLALEQAVWRYKKGALPGDNWTIPVIGKYVDSMRPTLENYQKQWAAGSLSAVSVFNIFIVMATSNEFSRKVFNSPNHAEPCLVHSAKVILRPDNWVFLTGKVHVDYRKVLNTLFTRKALGIYSAVQDQTTRKHFKRWLKTAEEDPSAKPIMMTFRDLNMETSLLVFCGPHIEEEAAREIADNYWRITVALELVNFPFPFPGTKVWKAIQARKTAMKHLENAAAKSKIAMAAGKEPECMLDHWIQSMAEPGYKGRKDFSDMEMAMVVFSFLFASQDAMSSGVIYGMQHLADMPDILAKVREEQERVRGGDGDRPLTLDMLDQMTYLRAFVRESLRVKPPVTMVPYLATKSFPISDSYTAPSGSIVIASVYPSVHDPEVYPQPSVLVPERWLDPEGSANTTPKNYLIFGSGPHKCIGVEYAIMNTMIVLADAAMLLDFEHIRTPESDKVQIIATLFPQDGCLMKLRPRQRA